MKNSIIALALFWMAGCHAVEESPSTATVVVISPDAFSGERALAFAGQLVAVVPRHAGSEGPQRAARVIRDAIAPFTDDCRIDAFQDQTPNGLLTFYNVIATRRGTGHGTVILGSHVDAKSGISDTFQGANDSGSSTGVLIEMARVLQAQPRLPFDVVFAFFDGEECIREYGPQDGLHGSRHYAQQLEDAGALKNMMAVIVLDMIGDKDLAVAIPRNTSKAMAAMAFAAADADGVRQRFRFAAGSVLDDHVPFFDKNIPTLNLIDFEYGTAPGKNDLWHTENDTLDHLSAESLQIIGRVTLRILNALAAERPLPQP